MPRPLASRTRLPRPLALLALLAVQTAAQTRRPSLSGLAKSPNSNQEESLGSQLLTAVLSNNLPAAATILESVSAAQAVRLANAIDWRGKSVLMHAASHDHAEMVKLLLERKARVDASDYTGGATALMLAARNGSLAAVEALTEAGANVQAATPQGTTVLMQAVANGSLPVIAHIIRAGGEVNAKDKSGASALSVAASLGNAQVVRLLGAAGATIDAADNQGSTPLLVAAAAAHLETVKALLELGADPNIKVTVARAHRFGVGSMPRDSEGMTPLMEASRNPEGFAVAEVLLAANAQPDTFSVAGFNALAMAAGNGNAPIVALLLQGGADPNALHDEGSTALMAAAENGSVPIVSALLKVGAAVNTARYDGLTALMAGCGQNNPLLIETLLQQGADPNAKDSRGVTACHVAAEVGAVEVVAALIKAGADCTVMAEVAAITPLIVASAAGEEQMVSLLLAITSEVDALHPDKSAMTALMAAASNGSTSIVDLILAAGAEINLRNSDGVTALMHAAVLGHLDVVEQLLAKGADINAVDNDGFDALVAAATGGSAPVSRLLIEKGLDVNVMAGSGGSPLIIAARAGAVECVELLLKAGALVDARAAPSEAFVAEITALQEKDDATMSEQELDAKRQRLDAYFEEGSTALMYAAALGHHEVVTLLVAAGADCRVKDKDGQSPLVHAANTGSVKSVQTLLEKGNADPNDANSQGVPLLANAVASGAEALAELLIKAGADVNAPGGGVSPLLLASQAGSTKLIQLLINKGAQVQTASEAGVTPLMVLSAAGNLRGTKVILEAAKLHGILAEVVDAATENGTAALHTAARQAHTKVVQELVNAGASVTLRDLGGQTALGAAYDGLQAVAKYVEEALQEYADPNDHKLGNDMLARAAGPHVEVMELLLAQNAEPSLIDKDGNTVDATAIVKAYRALSRDSPEATDGAKDEL